MIRSQDLIKSVDAAEMLGITVDQLRKRVRDGYVIPVVRERNFMLFSREELSELIPEESSGT
jgi:predicted site-specific integrase-resolvase|tara:strand:+ start:321 stop:506 length:186 start_codon:yes stop_codon:yes gene_type:complete